MQTRRLTLGVLVLLFGCSSLFGGELTVEAQKLVNRELKAWVTAYNNHDATAVAKLYAEDANMMTPDGTMVEGRAAIKKSYEETFSKNPSVKAKLTKVSHRLIAPGVVAEDGTWEESGHSEANQPSKGLYCSILLKKDGKWLVIHEYGWVPVEQTLDAKSAIKMLSAFVGDWEYTGMQKEPPAAGLPFGGAGEYSGIVSERLILGGNFLESRGIDKNPGGTTEITRIVHFDPETRKFVENQYTSEGTAERSQVTVSSDGKVWTSMAETTTKTGSKVVIRRVTAFKENGNRLDSVVEVSTDDGTTWAEWFRDTAKKVK